MSETAIRTGSPVIPSLRYRDAHAAIAWLSRTLGFELHACYDGPENSVAHAQLTITGRTAKGMIMLGSVSNDREFSPFLIHPDETGGRSTQPIHLAVQDAADLYERALLAGADIIQPLAEMPYGGKAFGCRDLEGYVWSVGDYDPWADD